MTARAEDTDWDEDLKKLVRENEADKRKGEADVPERRRSPEDKAKSTSIAAASAVLGSTPTKPTSPTALPVVAKAVIPQATGRLDRSAGNSR